MRLWPRRHPSSGAPHVIIVDDDDALRASMARVLRRAGYAVEDTGDPRLALDRLARKDEPVAVVVCDVVMPIMNGIVFGQRMRQLGVEAPLVYISGLAEESALRDWGIPASTRFLGKPFEPDELVAVVEEAVGGSGRNDRADAGMRS